MLNIWSKCSILKGWCYQHGPILLYLRCKVNAYLVIVTYGTLFPGARRWRGLHPAYDGQLRKKCESIASIMWIQSHRCNNWIRLISVVPATRKLTRFITGKNLIQISPYLPADICHLVLPRCFVVHCHQMYNNGVVLANFITLHSILWSEYGL